MKLTTIKFITKRPLNSYGLERVGIRVNVCCRSGECSLCRLKLVSDKVYLANGMLLRLVDSKFGYIFL